MERIEVTLFMTTNGIKEHGLPCLDTLTRMGATFGRTPSGWQYATITCKSLDDHCLGDWITIAQWGGWITAVEYFNGWSEPFDIRAMVRKMEAAA